MLLDTIGAKTIAANANSLLATVTELEAALEPRNFESTEAHMQYCAGTVCGLMDEVRMHGDALEAEVDDKYWPLPKYREMLFIK